MTKNRVLFGRQDSNRSGMLTKINDHFFPDNEYVDQSYVYLKGEITVESCSEVIESIIKINYPSYSKDEEGFDVEDPYPDVINLFITSSGGDMSGAFSLINIIRGSRIPVRTIALGEASSAGLCILMSGHQRVVTPYSTLMSHSFSSGAEGTFHDLINAAEAFKTFHEKILEFYIECTGLDIDFVKKNLLAERDHYFSPETAIEYNMVDLVSTLE